MNANDLFTQITEQLITDIETGAAGTWRMPWHALADAGTPTSIDGRPYRGMNAVWLPMVAASHDWTSGVWATYRGWQRHNSQVRRGEKATQIVLWKPTNTTADNNDTDSSDNGKHSHHLLARAYSVFAAEQVDGADAIINDRNHLNAERDTPKRIATAETYFATIGATVIEGGNRAYYQPSTDDIHIPHLGQFDHAAHYYSTLCHEQIHRTGHPSRLNRNMTGRFGDDAYAAEELVAELGAAMWSAQHGISSVTRTDHAAYLAGWLRVLRTDARALITVASKAQAAIDHLNTLAGHTPTTTTDDIERDDAA
jgi:antirestriction protein ArdC